MKKKTKYGGTKVPLEEQCYEKAPNDTCDALGTVYQPEYTCGYYFYREKNNPTYYRCVANRKEQKCGRFGTSSGRKYKCPYQKKTHDINHNQNTLPEPRDEPNLQEPVREETESPTTNTTQSNLSSESNISEPERRWQLRQAKLAAKSKRYTARKIRQKCHQQQRGRWICSSNILHTSGYGSSG